MDKEIFGKRMKIFLYIATGLFSIIILKLLHIIII